MVIKITIFVKCNATEFVCWDFCMNWISNFNVDCVFLVTDYYIWSFTNVERKSLALSQFSIHSGWTLFMSLSDAKTVVSSAKWTKRIWFEDLYMPLIYKRKSTGPDTDPCETAYVMFDIEGLQFLIETYCFLLFNNCIWKNSIIASEVFEFLRKPNWFVHKILFDFR